MQKYCIANYKSISFTPFRFIAFYMVKPAWDNGGFCNCFPTEPECRIPDTVLYPQ